MRTIPNWVGSTLFLVTLAVAMLDAAVVLGARGPLLKDYVEGRWLSAIDTDLWLVMLAAMPAVGILLSVGFAVGWFASGKRFRRSAGVAWSLALGMAILGWPVVIGLAFVNLFATGLAGGTWEPVR